MDKINDGGTAFPVPGMTGLPNGDFIYGQDGMTLRDYFAAHAPPPPDTWKARKDDAANIIVWRWAYADEMLKAREF